MRPTAPVRTPEASIASLDGAVAPVVADAQAAPAPAVADISVQAPLPSTVKEQAVATEEAPAAVAEQRGPVEYEVASGDTVSTIAEHFGISTETVLWANSLSNSNMIKIGQTLLILPTDGLVHTVVKGDTLLSIALRYSVDTESILGYPANDIHDADSLSIGQELVIPGGQMPSTRTASSSSSRGGTRAADAAPSAPAPAQVAPPSGRFVWPVGGRITQYFGPSHDAVDLAAPLGTPIAATDGGVVVDLQQLSWGLGWYVTIDHGNGYTSTYSHLGSFGVSAGQRISQGQIVGRIGMTGLTTGPHLHFIVRRNGVPVNPLGVLP